MWLYNHIYYIFTMEILNKINWKWLLILTVDFVSGGVLTSCSDDDDDDDEATSELVGIWASVEDIDNGDDVVFAILLKAEGIGFDGEYDLADKRFYPEEYSFEWRVEGDLLYVSMDGQTDTRRFSVSDNRVKLYYSDGYCEEFIRVR